MAIRKRPQASGSRPQPAKRSFREQLEALGPLEARGSGAALPRAVERASVPAAVIQTLSRGGPLPEDPCFKDLALGVRRLPEPSRATLPPLPVPVLTRAVAPRSRLWVERREGSVWAVAEGLPRRILEDLRAGKVVPRRQLDLHRRSAAEARQLLDDSVPRARREGVACLLVVCGRGTHSGGEGPVLPEVATERLSEALADEILAFCTAPRKWGGEGALLVRLRAARSAAR